MAEITAETPDQSSGPNGASGVLVTCSRLVRRPAIESVYVKMTNRGLPILRELVLETH